jgi:putative nucleotidyltransferase with HDIG domain
MPNPAPSAVPARATRWLTSAVSKAAALLILLGLAAGTGALLAPSVLDQLPPYGDESLGQIATQPVRLTRDYDLPDPEATDRRRQTALAEVRPVYDLDATLLGEVESRVTEGFAFARSVLGAQAPGAGRDSRSKLSPGDAEQLRQELIGRLQTSIEPRDFAALVKEGFSLQAETALAGLVRGELSQPVLEDRFLLPADRERGISVHPQPDGEGEGQVITDLDALRDLPAARADVERAADDLSDDFKPGVKRALGHLARGALRANLTYDAGETARRREHAQAEVTPVVLHFSRGERILEAGDRIEPHHLLLFRAIRSQAHPRDVSRIRLAGGLLAGLLIFLCYKLVRPTVGHRPSRVDALFLATVILGNLALCQALLVAGTLLREAAVPLPAPFGGWLPSVDLWKALPYAMPVTAGTVIVRALLGPELIGLYAIGSSVLFGLLRGEGSFTYLVFALAGSLIAARKVRAITRRRQLLRVGFFVATTNLTVIAVSELLAGHLLERQTVADLIAAAIGGAFAMPLVVGLVMPIFEAVFAYVSDRRLAELCNLNQPALKELIVRAPGTYHHSILLAGLAEGAAEAIGANPMLARAIGLYHDLGKGKAPLVFSENQKGGRETVAVGELAETLRRHVDDGVELGRRHKLPRLLLDAIAQHHGTRLVGQSAEGRLGGGFISEIRYRGPRPRRRETALVLLADSIEAQSRRIAAKDLSRLRELVHASVMQVAAEGQLDDSQLQLGDLPKVIDSFTDSLTRILSERGTEPPALREMPVVGHRSALDIN